MTEAIRIRRNSLFSLLSALSRVTANFVLFWLIARCYTEENYGQFTFAQTLATNFLFLADFGFDILLTTEIARDRQNAKNLFQKYYSLKLIFSTMALIGMWLMVAIIPLSSESRLLIFIFSFYMFFSALTNFLFAFFKGFERMEYETNVSFIINIGLLVSVVVLVFCKVSILVIGLVFLFSRIAGFAFAVYYSSKVKSDLSFRLDYSNIWETKNKILVFGLFLLFNNLFFQIDTLLLGIWKGEFEVGIYQSVFKFILLPLIIPDIFTNALMPALSRFYTSNRLQWERTGFMMNKLLSVIVIPISVILFVYADQIVHLLYGGQKYLEAIPVLRILSLTLFVRFSFEAFSIMLTTSNRQHIRMWAVISAATLNIVLNYYFIKKYGALGASIVSFVSNLFVILVYLYFLRRLFVVWILKYEQLFLYLFSISIFIVAWWLRSINVFIGTSCLLVVFVPYIYYLYFDKDEKKIIFSTDVGLSIFKKR